MSRLKQRLGRDLVWAQCRRHSVQRHMVKSAIVVMGDTKGTSWQIFKIVCDNWAGFAKDDTHSGIDYEDLNYYQWARTRYWMRGRRWY